MKFITLFLLVSLQAFAQKADRIGLLNEKRASCERIIAEFSGKPESLDLLIKEGREGLKIVNEKDYEYIYAFHQAMGTGYYYKQDFKSAKEHFEQSYAVAVTGKMIDKSLKPLGNLISINYYMGLSKDADGAAEKLKHSLPDIIDPKIKADAYFNLGMYNQQQKFYYGTALENFLKSIELYRTIIDTTKIVKLKTDYAARLMMVAEVYLQLKQPQKALQYLNETKPFLGLALIMDISIYGKYVRSYALLKNKEEALKYYNLLHETAAKTNGNWSELVSSSLIMSTLSLEGKEYLQAKFYLDKADIQARKDNKEIMTSSVNLSYGDYYKSLKDYKNAAKYYKISEPGSALYNKEQYLELLKSLTAVEIMSGDPKDAGAYFDKYISLSDSLTNQKISLNLAEMEAMFQNKNKQLQIDAQNVELTYAKKQSFWLIGGILLTLLVVTLLIVIYRNKKRTADLLHEQNRKLTQLNNDLEEANQTKAKLFGIISHDLRSPINQVYQFLKLQQLNPNLLNENQKIELGNKIQTATGSLLETMEELLLWSKSQMNQFKTDIRPVDLKVVLDQSLQLLELNIDAKKVKIQNEILQSTFVKADLYYLQTVVRNLLQNAIKASWIEGVVDIEYVENKQETTLSIRNSGAPFTQEQYEQILASTENGLSGMGLKLVDELSRKTGVSINFENKKGDSTQVNLRFSIS
ncbi:hypothetical protein Dfri01_09470 [Dyadobacter frigoris]|uniref:tetratricopeptide repeat-containing sensor histidine kinase n=1 Tax=Dyadobacter frigoris TaxID=2576211 RepID=UPI0024A1BDB4|nr:ATP-binding protein [Dyadobacter frigoris]GLU51486.1 hypothetical protein Dfri01_09470 [Dyadobacter frigoris]